MFIDTSALYALADRGDANHLRAVSLFRDALESDARFVTHSYVLVEAMALLQHRLGLEAALALADDSKAFDVEWVGRALHDEGTAWLRRTKRRQVSLVDAVSFAVMRSRRIDVAFAFDPHFAQEGFRLLTPDS
jgi:predicted nucleic acid-binding protein